MFDPEMDAIVQARSALERDIRTGLSQNQFRLFYQPLVNLRTQEGESFEALDAVAAPRARPDIAVRIHSAGGRDGFDRTARRMGVAASMRGSDGWPDDISVSVNLSPLQFAKGDLVSTVMSALASSGLPASRLELEITESVLLERSDRNIRILDQLHELGVRISMDDFGTGYSSIGYLRSFHFDKIKIDQSFVKICSRTRRASRSFVPSSGSVQFRNHDDSRRRRNRGADAVPESRRLHRSAGISLQRAVAGRRAPSASGENWRSPIGGMTNSRADELDCEYAAFIAERTVSLMSRLRIPQTPANYSIWFNYCQGASPGLKKAIDDVVRK